jgi:hypothetical protein
MRSPSEIPNRAIAGSFNPEPAATGMILLMLPSPLAAD